MNDGTITKEDIDKMDAQKVEELSAQIGLKAGAILSKAAIELNEILNVYGMQAKLGYEIEPLTKPEISTQE